MNKIGSVVKTQLCVIYVLLLRSIQISIIVGSHFGKGVGGKKEHSLSL